MAKWQPPVIFLTLLIILFAALNTFVSGFNVETVEYKNISFTVWDVGGQVSLMICDHLVLYRIFQQNCAMCIVQCCSIYFLSRTRSGHSGATTSRTPKDSSSSLTAMTGTRVEQHFRFLTIFRSQGKSRRGTRRADEDARRGRAEGGGEHQDAPPLVQHQPPYSDFRCC